MFIPNNSFFRAIWQATSGASQMFNIRHYQAQGNTGTGITYEEASSAIFAAQYPTYKVITCDDLTHNVVICQGIDTSGALTTPQFQPTSSNLPGTLTGDTMPELIAGVISLRTDYPATRQRRGRFYAFYPNEASNSVVGNPTNTYVGLLQSHGTVLANTIAVTGGTGNTSLAPVVMSFKVGSLLQTPITGSIARSFWGTFRSRRPGHGV